MDWCTHVCIGTADTEFVCTFSLYKYFTNHDQCMWLFGLHKWIAGPYTIIALAVYAERYMPYLFM